METADRNNCPAISLINQGVTRMEERIDELEMRYMHQEKAIQELNEIVSRQELVIDFLRREIVAIREQSLMMAPSAVRDADQEEPPPHY